MKTKVLVSRMVTAQLIYAFGLPCAESKFSHDTAQGISAYFSIKKYDNNSIYILGGKYGNLPYGPMNTDIIITFC